MDEISKAIQANHKKKLQQISGQFSDELEKARALPIGTIKKRGPNNMIKTTNGWKYHSRANGSQSTRSSDGQSSKSGKKEEFSQDNLPSVGDKVQVGTDITVISYEPFKGQTLEVEKIVDTGLISEPKQIKVKNDRGDSIIMSPKDLKPAESEGIKYSTSYGDGKYSSLPKANLALNQKDDPSKFTTLKTKDGKFLVTTKTRANKFVQQGDASKIQSKPTISQMNHVFKTMTTSSKLSLSVKKDKANPNFLKVNIKYPQPAGAVPKGGDNETQVESAKAIEVGNRIATEIKKEFDVEDIDVVDMKNGTVQVFAVSDEFLNLK